MLRNLQVRDLAIIEAVDIDFSSGLTVLTGETGAGKSMLVDAIELLAGGRAGAEVIRAGAERTELCATVDISGVGGELRRLLEEQSLVEEGELLIRRSISADGRSRAWLNGQSVPVALLRTVGELLFDIHGQHEFQSLVRSGAQRELLDTYGQLESLSGQVRAAHAAWLALMNRSVHIEAAASDRHARLDLLRYQVQELEALQLQAGEFVALSEERSRIAHRGRLAEAARQGLAGLYEDESGNAHQLMARTASSLRSSGAIDPELAALHPPLDEAIIRVQEVAHALARYLEGLEFDPERQEAVERRMAAIEELSRKHRVEAADLPAWHSALQRELSGMESAAADLGALRAQVSTALNDYQRQARLLSQGRARAAGAMSGEISERMQELGLAGGRFVVELAPLESVEPAPHGTDRVEFRVSTNPGQPPRAVAKIASGGELARLSLAVQVSCARSAAPCMVFDEVDAGIGGAVAEIVGRELRRLGGGAGTKSQALCVTHLAQVAAQGHQHLRVAKLTDGRSTRISVTALTGAERIEEIARMLGGLEITARARAHATEMIERAASETVPEPAAPEAVYPKALALRTGQSTRKQRP